MDLGVEIPRSPLDAVMSHEVWSEYHDRLAELIREHRTTLVFVNTRRMAERTARHLSDRLGEDAVTAHHGSLSKDTRLNAETRLKAGSLRALVATASLELGIDIGHVDLVCQIGSPHRMATLLQRVGRSGHTLSGTPKGRVFPTSRDDLIECAALVRAVRRGELDAIVSHEAPLDVLAQQIVAETACRPYEDVELLEVVRRAWPYRDLSRHDFDAVLGMTAEGFSTRRGRRSALVHLDEVNGTVRGRRGARLLAQTSGGAIPEIADYRVILEPEDTFIGTLNEDFAIESNAGDIFQLGNASWQILQVSSGVVRVADAKGAPPTIPFWLGEAPARSDELSKAVSDLRSDVDGKLGSDIDTAHLIDWFASETGVPRGGAEQALGYLADGRRSLGVIPSLDTLVVERFFDESGGMQLVMHAPFGSRVNKAWALALRKRFCRQFNFELQAAATEDALMLSLGPQHSFPLSDVFRYLHPETTRDVLVQAFLDAPVFETRWRWNATVSLAVPRTRGARKLAPQIQRMLAEDLLSSVFPDAAACLENIPGDRQIPDHPLVNQTVKDCLEEAMDFEGLRAVLARIHSGELQLVARDTPEPSVFAHEILNARPYAFMDDAPLEERRSHAVQTRRAGDVSQNEMGALDRAAIERVRDEERPDPRDADELHDELMTAGFLKEGETHASLARTLALARRATRVTLPASEEGPIWMAAERLPEILTLHPDADLDPVVQAPPSRARSWTSIRCGHRARPRPPDADGADDRASSSPDRSAWPPAKLTRRSSSSSPRGSCCAAALPRPHRPMRRSSGAIVRCSRGSTATRSTVCAQRSSRSAPPSSRVFSSSGSTSIRPIACAGSMAFAKRWRCSMVASCPPLRGNGRSCRRGSKATSLPCSTSSACRAKWDGPVSLSPPPKRSIRLASCRRRRSRCFCVSTPACGTSSPRPLRHTPKHD